MMAQSVRRLISRILAAAVAVAVLAVTGLTVIQAFSGRTGIQFSPTESVSPSPSRAVGIIPWLDASPSPSPGPSVFRTPDPATVRACAADDLAFVGEGWSASTGGQLSGGAVVANLSAEDCQLSGVPRVDLLDATGTLIAAGSAGEASARSGPLALSRGDVAAAGLTWENWCAPPPRTPLQLRLTLANGDGTLTAPVRAIGQGQALGGAGPSFPSCEDSGSKASIGANSAFTAPEPSSGTASGPCTAAQLAAFRGHWGPAAGTAWAALVVLNVPGFDCLLPSSPPLELRDADGNLVATAEPFPSAAASFGLPAGYAATAMVGLTDWCAPKPKGPLRMNLLIGSAHLPVTGLDPVWVPVCNSPPGEPHVGFFLGGPLILPNSPPPPEPNPADSIPVSVTVSLPASARAGSTLPYTVTLTDEGPFGKGDNLAFMCPNYTERLTLADGSASGFSHALNCAPAGWLESGQQVTFAMEIPIPTDAPTGTATVMWQLGDHGATGKANLEVTATDPSAASS